MTIPAQNQSIKAFDIKVDCESYLNQSILQQSSSRSFVMYRFSSLQCWLTPGKDDAPWPRANAHVKANKMNLNNCPLRLPIASLSRIFVHYRPEYTPLLLFPKAVFSSGSRRILHALRNQTRGQLKMGSTSSNCEPTVSPILNSELKALSKSTSPDQF